MDIHFAVTLESHLMQRSLRTATVSSTGTMLTIPMRTGLKVNAWSSTSRNFVATVEQPAVTGNSLLSGLTAVDFRGAFGNSSDANNADWFISAPGYLLISIL
jgi:hypothetical protein